MPKGDRAIEGFYVGKLAALRRPDARVRVLSISPLSHWLMVEVIHPRGAYRAGARMLIGPKEFSSTRTPAAPMAPLPMKVRTRCRALDQSRRCALWPRHSRPHRFFNPETQEWYEKTINNIFLSDSQYANRRH